MTEGSSERALEGSSDSSFGLVFTVVFAIIGLWPLRSAQPPHTAVLALSGLFFLTVIVRPALLAPLNRLWTQFGLLLHRIISPIVMGILFYTTVTPIGVIMRFFGKETLQLKFDPKAESYWIVRDKPGPAPESMKRQF
ncbi:MAG: hypothetical protein HQL52_16095 [Magnetococcales bacterium]|nr:hypothetical protein [Magnetococcales bacterium]